MLVRHSRFRYRPDATIKCTRCVNLRCSSSDLARAQPTYFLRSRVTRKHGAYPTTQSPTVRLPLALSCCFGRPHRTRPPVDLRAYSPSDRRAKRRPPKILLALEVLSGRRKNDHAVSSREAIDIETTIRRMHCKRSRTAAHMFPRLDPTTRCPGVIHGPGPGPTREPSSARRTLPS
jgi:hypothetical protein